MSAIFLSHSSADDEVAAEVRERLARLGHRSVFLDFDPERGIPAGRRWEQELYRQLRACRALIVLCSERSMASRWCFAEITHARALGKHIFPLAIDRSDVDAILGEHQVIDFTAGREEAFRRLERGLAAAGIDAADPFDWDGSRCPYPGLLALQEEDAAVFFGRDDEIGAGLDTLNRIAWQGGPGLLLILGASGSGKSSLLRAGLLPRLRRDLARWLIVGPLRPGREPLAALALALAAASSRHGGSPDREEVEARLADPQQLRPLIDDLRLAAARPEAKVLLVIDQLEELLGQPREHPATAFLALLRHAAEIEDRPLVALATMRSDFLAAWQKAPALRHAAFESLAVGPLDAAALAAVIERPAALAGVELGPGLVPAILADAETEDALPLLAFTLRRLYTEHAGEGRLRSEDYRRLGGLQGAVARAAETVLADARLSRDQEEALRRAFLAMVRVDREGRFARRPAAVAELPQAARPLLERFVRARLLVSRGDGQAAALEVAHEALFRAWGKLADWLAENRAALLLHGELRRSARRWCDQDGAEEYGWRGGRLQRAIELRDRELLQLSAEERRFLDASARAERREEARRRRMRRIVVVTSVVMALLMAALAALAVISRQHETKRRLESQVQASRILAVQARNSLDDALDVGLLLSLEAAAVADTFESRTSLLAGLTAKPPLDTFLFGHWDLVWSVGLDPAGVTVTSGSNDGTIRLWDLPGKKSRRVLRPRAGRVLDVATSPDGETLASAHNDGTVRLWDLSSGEPVAVLDGKARVLDVDFSPDGALLAAAASDGDVRLWRLATGELVRTLSGHRGWVWNARFDPAGEVLASAGDDGDVRLWRVAGGEPLDAPLRAHDGIVHSLSLAPDGKWIAAGRDDGRVSVWAWPSRRLSLELSGHRGEVRGLAFDPAGGRLASASVDGTVRVWALPDGRQMASLGPHVGGAWDVAFAGDGRTLVSGDGNGTIYVWDLGRPDPAFFFAGHAERLTAIAFAADGIAAASGDFHGRVQLWDLASGALIRELPSHGQQISALAFTPDGRTLASATGDHQVRIFEVASGGLRHQRSDQPTWLWALAFSPDGETLASGGDDGSVRLWEVASGRPGLLFRSADGSGVRTLAFDPDGRTLAAGTERGAIQLFDPRSGELRKTIAGHPEAVTALAFDSGGRILASGSPESYVRLWRLPEGQPLQVLKAHQASIESVAFGPRGTLASGALDGLILIWDLERAVPRFGLVGHASAVLELAFAPDGELLSGSIGGHARTWSLDMPAAEAVAGRACRRANRNFTSDEWRHHFADAPYEKTCPELPHGDETWQQ